MSLLLFTRGRIGSHELNDRIAVINKQLPKIVAAAPVNAVAASLTTALTGANNDLVITAKTKGVSGEAISIKFTDPGEDKTSETVTVTGKDIEVVLRSATGTLSTAAQVKAAIEGNTAANALVSVANAAANDGTGNVTALVKTSLDNAVDGTVGAAFEQQIYGTDLFICKSSTGNTVAQGNWYKVALTLVS